MNRPQFANSDSVRRRALSVAPSNELLAEGYVDNIYTVEPETLSPWVNIKLKSSGATLAVFAEVGALQ